MRTSRLEDQVDTLAGFREGRLSEALSQGPLIAAAAALEEVADGCLRTISRSLMTKQEASQQQFKFHCSLSITLKAYSIYS